MSTHRYLSVNSSQSEFLIPSLFTDQITMHMVYLSINSCSSEEIVYNSRL